jgi:hypothetical protein
LSETVGKWRKIVGEAELVLKDENGDEEEEEKKIKQKEEDDRRETLLFG